MKRPKLQLSARKLLAGVVEIGYRMKNVRFVRLHRCS